MLKKKTLILAGAILAGAALVGGTFAVWAVTDNADPFAIKITPGDLTIGTTKSVTLEWGETRSLTNISGLRMDQEAGPFTLGLKATTSDNSSIYGELSATLATTSSAELKLIDNLIVNFYDGAEKGANEPIMTVPNQYSKSSHVDIQVTSGTEKIVSIYVSIKPGLTPEQYNAIKEQQVTLTLDWNKSTGHDYEYVTAVDYYFNNGDKNWANVYAYFWNSETGAQNHEWPGLAMVNVSESIWSMPVDSTPGYDKVIFNNGAEGNENVKTGDIALEANKPYYTYSIVEQQPVYEWEAAPTLNQFYLVSTNNNWAKGQAGLLEELETPFVHDTETYQYAISGVVVSDEDIARLDDGHGNAGYQFKIQSSTNVWYGEHGPLDGNNVGIGTAGTWTFYFNPQGNNGTFIYCVQA